MDAKALAGFEARAAEAERRLGALERSAGAGATGTLSPPAPPSRPVLSFLTWTLERQSFQTRGRADTGPVGRGLQVAWISRPS